MQAAYGARPTGAQRMPAAAARQADATTLKAQLRAVPISGAGSEARIGLSPYVQAQRRTVDALFGSAAQRRPGEQDDETALQKRADPSGPAGMPYQLRSGIESLSGMDMSDVRVHRNSEKPAQLNALAYAQGQDIHLAPGQERHLPHEAWHVVQQRQGRVQATLQMAGVPVNDDEALEREADVMGQRAVVQGAGVMTSGAGPSARQGSWIPAAQAMPLQRHAASSPVAQLGVMDYLGDVVGSAGWFLKSVLWDMPAHVWRIIKHLTVGLGVTLFDMGSHLVRAIAAGVTGRGWAAVGQHLGALVVSGLGWPLKLLGKILDLAAFGEAMDLVMQIFKFNTRSMNGPEIAAAQIVFGNKINYKQVRVDEFSLLNTYLFRFWIAFTTWHTVNWPRGSDFTSDPGTFIHELTHVWQMERRGTQYIAEAPIHGGLNGGGYIYAQDRDPFNDANGQDLAHARAQHKTIWDYNLEQQAEICRHYFERHQNGDNVADWQPFINDIQGLNTMPLTKWLREPDFLPWA